MLSCIARQLVQLWAHLSRPSPPYRSLLVSALAVESLPWVKLGVDGRRVDNVVLVVGVADAESRVAATAPDSFGSG